MLDVGLEHRPELVSQLDLVEVVAQGRVDQVELLGGGSDLTVPC
jgi:hypothetical protein